MKTIRHRISTLILSLLLAAAAAPHVAAHGFVWQVSVNSEVYKGNTPNGATNPSAIRQISDISPVKGAGNPDINCGLSAKPASLIATANPGDVLYVGWGGGGGQHVCHPSLHGDLSDSIHTVASQHRSHDDIHGIVRWHYL